MSPGEFQNLVYLIGGDYHSAGVHATRKAGTNAEKPKNCCSIVV